MKTFIRSFTAALLLGGAFVSPGAHAQVGAGLRSSSAPLQGIDPSMPLTSNGQPTALYVDGTLGSDSGACASSGTGACRTIQAAVNKLPAYMANSDSIATPHVTINVAAGTYAETVRIAGISVRNRSGPAAVKIIGATSIVANNSGSNYAVGTASANDIDTGADNGTRRLTISPSPGWTTDAYKGMWVEGVTGTSAGSSYVIVANGADTIDYLPAARGTASFSTSSTVRVVDTATTISGQVLLNNDPSGLMLYDVTVAGGASVPVGPTSAFTSYLFASRARFTGPLSTSPSTTLAYSGQIAFASCVFTASMRFANTTSVRLPGTYFDYRGAASQLLRFDNISRVDFDSSLVEGPAVVTLESTIFSAMPKLLNRSGAAPAFTAQYGTATSSTGNVHPVLVSISSAATGTALTVTRGATVGLHGGVYVTNAAIGINVAEGGSLRAEGVVSVAGTTTFFVGSGGARAYFNASSVAGTGATNGYNLSGGASVVYAGTAPSVTSGTNNVSVDGGSSYVTYAATPIGHASGASYSSSTPSAATVQGTMTLATPLAVASGGTGAATLTSGAVLVGAGTSAVSSVASGVLNNVLTSDGSTWSSGPPPLSPLDRNPQVTAYYQCGSATLQTVGAVSSTSYVSTFIGVDFGPCTAAITTGTAINGSAGWTTTPAIGTTASAHRTQVGMYLPGATANERVWPAFIGTVKNPETFDANSSARYCGIRYSTAASDTQWQCCSSNGTTASCEAMGARAAGIFVFSARMSTAACTCSLANWQTGAVSTTYNKTTHAPGGGSSFVYPSWGVRTLANSNDIQPNFAWATAFGR